MNKEKRKEFNERTPVKEMTRGALELEKDELLFGPYDTETIDDRLSAVSRELLGRWKSAGGGIG